MSNDVVISKELRDKLMSLAWEAGSVQLQNQLRTAPETVSLEGVDEFMASRQFHTMGDYELLEQHTAQDFVDLIHLVSDLRRIVSPVQPSAVVSREAVDLETATKDRDEMVTALKESVAMNKLNDGEWADNYFENQSKQESHQALITRIERLIG